MFHLNAHDHATWGCPADTSSSWQAVLQYSVVAWYRGSALPTGGSSASATAHCQHAFAACQRTWWLKGSRRQPLPMYLPVGFATARRPHSPWQQARLMLSRLLTARTAMQEHPTCGIEAGSTTGAPLPNVPGHLHLHQRTALASPAPGPFGAGAAVLRHVQRCT